jgi:hypothetical protein
VPAPACVTCTAAERRRLPQVAYLASSLFMDYKSDLIILIVNTITQDLKSDNYLVGEYHGCETLCLHTPGD